MNEVLTATEAADLLKTSTTIIRSLANDGKLPGFRLPGDDEWRFVRSQLLASLQTAAESTQAERQLQAKAFEKAKKSGEPPQRGRPSKARTLAIIEKYGPQYCPEKVNLTS